MLLEVPTKKKLAELITVIPAPKRSDAQPSKATKSRDKKPLILASFDLQEKNFESPEASGNIQDLLIVSSLITGNEHRPDEIRAADSKGKCTFTCLITCHCPSRNPNCRR